MVKTITVVIGVIAVLALAASVYVYLSLPLPAEILEFSTNFGGPYTTTTPVIFHLERHGKAVTMTMHNKITGTTTAPAGQMFFSISDLPVGFRPRLGSLDFATAVLGTTSGSTPAKHVIWLIITGGGSIRFLDQEFTAFTPEQTIEIDPFSVSWIAS